MGYATETSVQALARLYDIDLVDDPGDVTTAQIRGSELVGHQRRTTAAEIAAPAVQMGNEGAPGAVAEAFN